MNPLGQARLLLALMLLLIFSNCRKTGTSSLALEECDPAGYLDCLQQNALLSVPITDTNLFLTYSSRWNNRASQQGTWDAAPLGLGGWSLNLVERYDPANRILISGDGSWRLADGIKLSSGELAVPSYDGAVAYIFDSAGRHVRSVDGHLGTELVKITYDGSGHLLQLDGSANGQPVHVSIQRDADAAPRALIGIDGGATGLSLENGHLTAITNPAGETTRIAWNPAGLVESETNPDGGVQQFTYDASGQLASATDADGVIQRYERKASGDGIEIQVATALGRLRKYRAESAGGGIRRTFTAADGTERIQTTDPQGNRTVKLADGTTWSVGAAANPVWGTASPLLTPIEQTRPDGVRSRREVRYNLQPQRGLPYVLAGSITTSINGQLWTQNIDPTQRTVTLTDPAGRVTRSSYDERNRLLNYSAPGLAPLSYKYNTEGRIVSRTVGTGTLAHVTTYTYDANTGQIVIMRPDATVEKIAFDRAGRSVTSSKGDGSTVMVGFDSAGRMNQVQPPGGLNFTLGLSPAGRSTAFAPPMIEGDASIETNSYNKDGQLTTISGLGNRAIKHDYDAAGRIATTTFDQGKRGFSYDSHSGLVTQASDPSGVHTAYGYSGSIPASLTWSGPVSGSVAVSLDANSHPLRETVNGGQNLDFTYDAAGLLTGLGPLTFTRDPASGLVAHTKLGVVETTQQFDENEQLVRVTTTAADKTILDLRYTHDSMGRIGTVTETSSDAKSTVTEYSYDRGDRLASVRINGNIAETYSYDAAGNRVRLVRGNQKLEASYDDRNRIRNLSGAQYKWITDGRLTGIDQNQHATAFVYDDFGALRQVSLPDSRKITYFVDADGRRVGREIAGKPISGYLYRLDGALAAEVDASGKVVSRFAYDDLGRLAFVTRGSETYRVITDTVGSPLLVIDSRTGTIVEQIAYDAWGSVLRDTAPGYIPIGFAGGLRDPDTGLLRFGARDYDPVTGRWTAADPIRFAGGDANLYRYVFANPVNFVDRTGLECDYDVWVFFVEFGGDAPPGCRDPNDPGPPDYPPNDPTPPHNPVFQCLGVWCLGPGPTLKFCFACAFGDTHLENISGQHFDFQAAGEFLAAVSVDGKLTIQARQEPVLGGTEITFNTAVATDLNGDRIGVYAKEPSFLIVNGTALNDSDIEERLPHGGTLQRHGATVNLRWPDGTQLNIIRVASTLNYGIVPATNVPLTLRGLLGGSGSSQQQLIARDGATLDRSDPQFQTKLYGQFGNSWRIKQSESLFRYWPGESTATFTNLSIPTREVRASSLPSPTRSEAESICLAVGVHNQPAFDDCILDVGVTGMPAFAAASLSFGNSANQPVHSASAPATASTTAPPPPSNSVTSSSNADQYNIRIGDTVSTDRPAKGAGSLVKAGQKQTYSFAANAGDSVYVAIGPCSGGIASFTLVKPDNGALDGVSTCRDLGPIALPVTGAYRIIAEARESAVHYGFSLRTAVLNQFPIKVGDTVSPNHPAGAGNITQAGQQQSYAFEAHSGDIVFVGIGPCEGGSPLFDLKTPKGGTLDAQIGCHDIGRAVLPESGTYHLVARTDQTATRYTFFVHEVPADQHLPVTLPAMVSPGSPARGAGHINAQGAQQFYDFTASPGASIHVEGKCGTPCPNLQIRATSTGDNGRLGFLGLDHLSFDWKLPAGGRYTIQVQSNGYVGDYSFTAAESKPQRR